MAQPLPVLDMPQAHFDICGHPGATLALTLQCAAWIFKQSFKNSQFVSIRMNQLALSETSNKSISYIIC